MYADECNWYLTGIFILDSIGVAFGFLNVSFLILWHLSSLIANDWFSLILAGELGAVQYCHVMHAYGVQDVAS